MSRFARVWSGLSVVDSASFVCGHCGESISSDKGYVATDDMGRKHAHIYICHACNQPSYIVGSLHVPAAALGNSVSNLPPDIESIYEEIRQATSVNAYTSAVLTARKLLMHIAVEKGADTGKTFKAYVNYLETNHFTPPGSTSWVDRIRQLGNEANHEIVIMDNEQAQLILTFLEMLLKFIYGFPAQVPIIPETIRQPEVDVG